MSGAAPTDTRHMISPPTETEDPGVRVPTGSAGPSVSTRTLQPVDHPVGQEGLTPTRSHRRRRSGLILLFGVGCILAVAAAVPQHHVVFENSRESTNDRTTAAGSSEPLTSATLVTRDEASPPKLIVEPSVGVTGEPVPIGLAVRGEANDAIIIITGLVPEMELSMGNAVAPNSWQLPAAALSYTWIAPPRDFVGSVDLVAELRLPNGQIADRQMLHVEWTRLATRQPHDPEREQITHRQENEIVPPSPPPTVQNPNDRHLKPAAPLVSIDVSQGQAAPPSAPPTVKDPNDRHEQPAAPPFAVDVSQGQAVPPSAPSTVQNPNDRHEQPAAPPFSVDVSQGQTYQAYGKSARTRGRKHLHRPVNEGKRPALLTILNAGDGKPSFKLFWDWTLPESLSRPKLVCWDNNWSLKRRAPLTTLNAGDSKPAHHAARIEALLAQTEQQIIQLNICIASQQQWIDQLARAGKGTAKAESVVGALQKTLRTFEIHRERLLARL
jgi:hypothetical protein